MNNNIIPGAVSPVYIAQQNGLYTVAITDTNGCRVLSNPVLITISGIDAVESKNDFIIFPNPIGENASWNVEATQNLIGRICAIYDAEGKLVYKNEITDSHLEINLNVAKGIYFLKIISEQTIHSFKLIRL